jgi:hypothetical protein
MVDPIKTEAGDRWIYRVCFYMRPESDHPSYWELQFAIFNIWLLDETQEAALARAEKIVETLPYDVVVTQGWTLPPKPKELYQEWEQRCMEGLLENGFATCLTKYKTGTSEEEILLQFGIEGPIY